LRVSCWHLHVFLCIKSGCGRRIILKRLVFNVFSVCHRCACHVVTLLKLGITVLRRMSFGLCFFRRARGIDASWCLELITQCHVHCDHVDRLVIVFHCTKLQKLLEIYLSIAACLTIIIQIVLLLSLKLLLH